MATKGRMIKRQALLGLLVLAVGIFLGWLLFGGNTPKESEHQHSEGQSSVWTCSMHPQIKKDGPGQCPICGMDLVPLNGPGGIEAVMPNEVPMSASAMKLAEVQTLVVSRQEPEKELRLLGKVKPDERLMSSQTAHIAGRIEKLYINFTGEQVRKGQPLASIYSPQLVTAQMELFEVLKDPNSDPSLLAASRAKLRQWKLSEVQVATLEKERVVQRVVDVLAERNGYVMKLNVAEGDYVKEGEQLMDVLGLEKVWILFEAYEGDLPWLVVGDEIDINVRSLPGERFSAKVKFIDPFIDPATRVAYIRAELPNPGLRFKPDMFADGVIASKVDLGGPAILVPKSAVLWTGKRSVVYVKLPNREHNTFLYREVILGEEAGDQYVITSGLEEGEEIAVNGVFKIDAAAQLAGKKSMMNPTGWKVATGHDHRASGTKGKVMEMGNSGTAQETMIDRAIVPKAFKKQLGVVVAAYLPLKDKLVNDDVQTQTEVAALARALRVVNMNLVLEDAHTVWMSTFNSIENDLILFKAAKNIEEQRGLFSRISNALYEAVAALGVQMEKDVPLYLDHCPMANGHDGGNWLSTDTAIKNPYFGAKMMKCGSIQDTLNDD